MRRSPARSRGRFGLDEDLAEALALAHDLGHPPFGHAGERALDECLPSHGGFDHNAQALRVVTALERRYPAFDGLNLTWETLEGLVKHNGPLTDRGGEAGRPLQRAGRAAKPIRAYSKQQDLELWSFASAEAQVAAIADDIAYDAHDIDDGLRAGLFELDELKDVPLVGDILREIDAAAPGLDEVRRGHELVRRLITRMIDDVIARDGSGASRRLRRARPTTSARRRGRSWRSRRRWQQADKAIKAFLYRRMYRHDGSMRIMSRGGRRAQGPVRPLRQIAVRHAAGMARRPRRPIDMRAPAASPISSPA